VPALLDLLAQRDVDGLARRDPLAFGDQFGGDMFGGPWKVRRTLRRGRQGHRQRQEKASQKPHHRSVIRTPRPGGYRVSCGGYMARLGRGRKATLDFAASPAIIGESGVRFL
jgi:hypothetical protein